MGLNAAGLTAILDTGDATVLYAAVGDGPLAADQVSDARAALTLAVQDGVSSAAAPLNFTGPTDSPATHLLLFSAATAGTFYGSTALTGDQAFNATGQFIIAELTVTGVAAGIAPLQAFTLGAEVGVPTGTTLTVSTGTGVNDGTEEITLVHPVTGEEAVIEAVVFRDRHWTDTLTVNPGPGQTFLFENCLFENTADNWCVEVAEDNGRLDQMDPLAVFRNCTFDGNGSTQRALLGPFSWVERSHLADAADGWQGGIYSVGIASNIIGGDDGGPDPHADGFQTTGVGHTTLYRCWISAGTGPGASSALRVGTEFSASTALDVRHCGLDLGGFTVQLGGQESRHITGVTFIGNRWQDNAGFGPTDFVLVDAPVTWEDNAYADGTPIENPVI
jgi:hypothetical protein